MLCDHDAMQMINKSTEYHGKYNSPYKKKIEENPNGVANGNARTNIYKLDQKPIDVIR